MFDVGRDSVVGIVTRFGLDGPGIESRWRRDFLHPSFYPPSLLWNGYWDFPGGKAAEAWPWPPTQPSAEVKESVELYFCFPSGPSWPVRGWILWSYIVIVYTRGWITSKLLKPTYSPRIILYYIILYLHFTCCYVLILVIWYPQLINVKFIFFFFL